MESSLDLIGPHEIYRAKPQPLRFYVLGALLIHFALLAAVIGLGSVKSLLVTQKEVVEVELISFSSTPADENAPSMAEPDQSLIDPLPPSEPEPAPLPPTTTAQAPEPEPVSLPLPDEPPGELATHEVLTPAEQLQPSPDLPQPLSLPDLSESIEPESKPLPELLPEPLPEPLPRTAPVASSKQAPVAEPSPPSAPSLPKPKAPKGGGAATESVAVKASTAASFDAGYLNNPAPRYPVMAFRQKAQGTVIVRAEVLPDGKSGQVVLHQSSGFKSLDDAAVQTVKTWRFRPATEDGKPVKQWVNIPITFSLNKR